MARRRGPARLRVQRLAVPPEVRPTFVRAATAGFAGFAVLGLFTAVSPLFTGRVLGVHDHLVVGVVASTLLAGSTVGRLLTARLPARVSLLGGCLVLVAGAVLVGAGVALAGLPVLLGGAVVAGVGEGSSFRAGLTAVTAETAAALSAVASSFILVLGVGAAAAVAGPVPAAVVFTGIAAALGLGSFASLLRRRGAVPQARG